MQRRVLRRLLRIAKQFLGAHSLGHLGAQRVVGLGQFQRALHDLRFKLDVCAFQNFDCPLAIRNVKRNPLKELRNPLFVADQLAFPVHPHNASIAGDQSILGAEVNPGGEGLREFSAPALPIFGMYAVAPEERIVEPFPLRETEQLLDLRADVELRLRPFERGEERDGGNLLHQRPIPKLGIAKPHVAGIGRLRIPRDDQFLDGLTRAGIQLDHRLENHLRLLNGEFRFDAGKRRQGLVRNSLEAPVRTIESFC